MLLLDPTLAPEHNLEQIRQKAANKFRFKASHLYLIAPASQGGGTELNSENIRNFLQDGLVVLASNLNKLHASYLPPSNSPPPNGESEGLDVAQPQAGGSQA